MTRRAILSILVGMCFIVLGLHSPTRLAAEDLGSIPKNAQASILRNPGTPAAGSREPDVVIVEFFDYNCPFCKKLAPALQGLLKADPKVALIYKDWPILSDASVYAAQAALAAGWQDKYLAAHDALMGASHLASNEQIDTLLRNAGIDMAILNKDRERHSAEIKARLQRNDTEVRALGIRGTPGLLVGRHIVNGVYDVPGLRQMVESARHDPT
jgi:protein-disulfide isomerase